MHASQVSKRSLFGAALALALSGAANAAAVTVYANNPAPGDAFTNPGPTNQGQPVGATGWVYNNVRNGGSVGISTANPHLGNASVVLSAPNNGKADIEFYAANLGAFSALSGASYDWYRDSSSTAAAHLHPSLRILIDLDGNLATTSDEGALIFERAYNPSVSPVPTDVWNSDSIGANTILWNNASFGAGFENPSYLSLATWMADPRFANASIIGFSSGIGSGWGPFSGAVDNIAWTISGVTTTTNFEVQAVANAVPEPGSLALAAIALLGLAAAAKKRSRR